MKKIKAFFDNKSSKETKEEKEERKEESRREKEESRREGKENRRDGKENDFDPELSSALAKLPKIETSSVSMENLPLSGSKVSQVSNQACRNPGMPELAV